MIENIRHLPERFPVTRRYLIGVSGGMDSVVLLHALNQLGYRRLIVLHLNHALRGRQSGADAVFVRRLAHKLGYEFESQRRDVRKLASQNKQSLETAARNARYTFFAEVAKTRRCRTLFLAHHADDQVETVLMNLFRGTGTSGLGGMRETSERVIQGTTLHLIRPLLAIRRADLLAYATTTPGLRYREDESNEDCQFLRNRVRHQLLPKLPQWFGRDVRSSVLRLADQSRVESAYLDSLVADAASQETLSVSDLRALSLALQRRLLFNWLKNLGVADLHYDLVQEALQLVPQGAAVAKINLPRDRHLRRRQGKLFVE